jgi:hypothetical protein
MELPREMQSPMKPLPSTFWIPESTLTTLLSSHVATGRVLERKSAECSGSEQRRNASSITRWNIH